MEKRKSIYELLNGDGKSSANYSRFMCFAIAASILPLCFKQTNTAFQIADKLTAFIFIADYILRWITADIKNNSKKDFIIYPFTFFAIIDLLSILPSLNILGASFKLFRVFRLLKAFKALKVLRYSKSFNIIVSVIQREKKGLAAVSFMALGYILLSALVMFQVEPDSFENFFDAIYWSVVTLTTVGYGDVYPVSDAGRIVSMISSFMGIAIVALPTGIITAGYMSELQNERNS